MRKHQTMQKKSIACDMCQTSNLIIIVIILLHYCQQDSTTISIITALVIISEQTSHYCHQSLGSSLQPLAQPSRALGIRAPQLWSLLNQSKQCQNAPKHVIFTLIPWPQPLSAHPDIQMLAMPLSATKRTNYQ